jgi:hypothetical protein
MAVSGSKMEVAKRMLLAAITDPATVITLNIRESGPTDLIRRDEKAANRRTDGPLERIRKVNSWPQLDFGLRCTITAAAITKTAK